MVVNFEEYVPVRMTKDQKKSILRICKKNKRDFPDVSLFVRAACNQKIREFDKEGRRR